MKIQLNVSLQLIRLNQKQGKLTSLCKVSFLLEFLGTHISLFIFFPDIEFMVI